jgi:hypothetical protein
MLKDVYNESTSVQLQSAGTALSADADSTAVDLWDYPGGHGGVSFYAMVGTTTETLDGSNYWEVRVEESDDNSTFTAAPNADLSNYVTGTQAVAGTFALIDAAAEDDLTYSTHYHGSKRYVRVTCDETGTGGIAIGILAIIGGKTYAAGA